MWYIRGGRGSGKTWTGSHQLAEWIIQNSEREWAVVAPTFGDARDVCIEGPRSGLLKALGLPRWYKGWNRSMGELFLPNGGIVFADGADDGALRIQGKNLAGLWADEVGLWKQWKTAWEESIAYAVRIDPALIVATGTPKRGHPLVHRLFNDEAIPKTLLRTVDNAENLSAAALNDLLRRYQGTTLGRQELEGEVLADAEGALVTRPMIVHRPPPTLHTGEWSLLRGAVAIDPAVSYGFEADETGIVAGAQATDGNGYVLADHSGRYTPERWAREAIALADELKFDLIIGEVNNGGDLVEANVRAAGWRGRFKKVHASQGKRVRAEGIVGGYERHLQIGAPGYRIYHLKPFPELEDQWCNWQPDISSDSPDRLDAEVWLFTELLGGFIPDIADADAAVAA